MLIDTGEPRISSGLADLESRQRLEIQKQAKEAAGPGPLFDLVQRLANLERMAQVNVHEAKTNLSRLLVRVAGGEEIVIARDGEPVARLVPFARPGRRRFGVDRGRFEVPEDFDAALPEDLVAEFES